MTPYEKHRDTPLWGAVVRAVADLVENQDITEITSRDYIVGYICESLASHLPTQTKD